MGGEVGVVGDEGLQGGAFRSIHLTSYSIISGLGCPKTISSEQRRITAVLSRLHGVWDWESLMRGLMYGLVAHRDAIGMAVHT